MTDTSDEKLVGIGVKIPMSMKTDLDNASYAEATDMATLVREGIALVLEAVRQRHGGTIPPKPQRQPISLAPAATETPKPRKGKR